MRDFSGPKLALSLLSLLSLAAACAPEPRRQPLADDPDQVLYELQIPENAFTDLNQAEAQLIADINAGKKVSFRGITELLYATYERDLSSNADMITARERYASIVPRSLGALDAVQIKIDFERSLTAFFNGRDWLLQREQSNPLRLLLEGKGQSYSASWLHSLVAREMGAGDYRSKQFVFIFSQGQIQPGWIEKRNDQHYLKGMDMTRTGRGNPTNFGALDSLRGNLVLIDADHLALLEIFRGRIDRDSECALRESLIRFTARKYALNSPSGLCGAGIQYLRESEELQPRTSERNSLLEVNHSLFAFGQSDLEAEIKTRESGHQEVDRSSDMQLAAEE